MIENWCGYIDMLATRAIAQRNTQDLRDALNNFHSALDSAFDIFKTGQCFAFSDGAFFRCQSFEDFVHYYRRFRNDLFQQQLFFRCSFIKGDIDVVERTTPPRRKEHTSGGYSRRFFSMTFGGDAAAAYQKESEFKGVGCSVGTLVQDGKDHPHLTTSYYVTQDRSGLRATRVTDIKFLDIELDRAPKDPKAKLEPGEWRVFDPLVDACQVSLSQSENIGAYYSTPLVTAIRSLSLKKVDYENDAWVNTPYVFEEMMSGAAPKSLRHMPGIHLILLTCFDQLFHQKKGDIPRPVLIRVLGQLSKFPQCFRRLDTVPNFVITHEARTYLVKLHVEAQREADKMRRIARSRLSKRQADK